MQDLKDIALILLLGCWSAAGVAATYLAIHAAVWFDDDGDEGGGDPDQPFAIDPDDPGDWWKYTQTPKRNKDHQLN